MLIPYDVHASDLGAAINIATKRAMAEGFTHTSVSATRQTSTTAWTITLFVANSQAVTRRGPGWSVDARGARHWCPQPSLCEH